MVLHYLWRRKRKGGKRGETGATCQFLSKGERDHFPQTVGKKRKEGGDLLSYAMKGGARSLPRREEKD